MSTNSPEQGQQLSLTDEVLAKSREAYDLLHELLYSGRESMFEEEHETSESKALSAVIGSFVTTNAAAGTNVGNVERTPELQAAASAWLEARLTRRLKDAMYDEQLKQAKRELNALLEGKTVIATSLKYGFAVGYGYGLTSSPGDPMKITAPFLAIEPAQGTIWLGTPQEHYQVQLYDILDPSQPASTIEVN